MIKIITKKTGILSLFLSPFGVRSVTFSGCQKTATGTPPPFLALSVSEAFRQKVSHIADLQKIVLLAPETFYIKSASEDFWTNEVNYWKTRGFSVLINSIAPVSYPNAMHLPMSLKEALWLGVSCHHVTTLATGFSCLLSFFQHSLTVVYTSHFDFWYFNFFKNFHLQHIHEIILPSGIMN